MKDAYTMFCGNCGWFRPIPDVAMKGIMSVASHVQWVNCLELNEVPRSLKYIALDMREG
ncbi:hypothetical protein RYX56_19880 [Alkalihalophilus lindianensis]|uniref:Uncharacterized protein n=1 Tax=Alkalihalophilus lindianensis TaxID=1630542 RepID=A0ABU3XFE6_9BACI|nr:hypothetical protein [Alkalihalophilus lindianensis]MDV2686622.1 hypothetical protein [Alkalihalophilus lindianensis]